MTARFTPGVDTPRAGSDLAAALKLLYGLDGVPAVRDEQTGLTYGGFDRDAAQWAAELEADPSRLDLYLADEDPDITFTPDQAEEAHQ